GCSGIAYGPYRDPADLERTLPMDKTGVICMRGLPTFEGYEVSPDRCIPLDTYAVVHEGWFDLGDMYDMDADGF
ncbi:hypothetical protein GGX14DRAFT_328637, partial [Mycena pura]